MTKHLESLYVKNFRCLDELTIDRLGDVNLLVGGNNSGKTTVLEALYLWANRGSFASVKSILDFHDEKEANDYLSMVRDIFYEKDFSAVDDQGIVIGKDRERESLIIKDCYFIEKKSDDETKPVKKILKEKSYNSDNNASDKDLFHAILVTYPYPIHNKEKSFGRKLIPEGKANSPIFEEKVLIPSAIINTDRKKILNEIDDLYLQGLGNEINEAIQIIEPSISDPRTLKGVIYVYRKNRIKPFPVAAMGEGITHILSFIIATAKAKNGILLIDEIENGLHYSIQEKVWEWLFELAKQYNMQIFATTHSKDIIENFNTVAQRRAEEGVLIRLGRSIAHSDKGKLIATCYSESQDGLNKFIQNDWEVR